MSVLDELVAGALEDQRTRELTVSLEEGHAGGPGSD